MNAIEPSSGSKTGRALPLDLMHDLRTSLNHVLGYTELLLDQAQERGHVELVPDLQKSRSAGRRMLTLLDDGAHSVQLPEAQAEASSSHTGLLPLEEVVAAFPSETPPGITQGTVLVVDDVEANRDLLSRKLVQQGYAVTVVKSGPLALARLGVETFDLVLLDIMMPEMDGYEVLRALKADETLRHLPVIMISALGEMDSVVRCIELGAEDYLPKPFNQVLLKARIGACLEKKRVHDREAHLFEQSQKSYQRLQELEKSRDDLTHMIVHDLRTPLNAMMMGMQELNYMGAMSESQQEVIEMIRRGGDTLIGMINDLLDISKMESGALRLVRHEIPIPRLIEEAVRQVAALATGKGLTLTTALAEDLPPLVADESKLLRTLVNLLGNAIKFTPPGGTVTIFVRNHGDGASLLFSVADTGEGIPSEAFGRIFEKFGQVESAQDPRMVSTGLGLTFCKLAVEAHGGHIEIESTPGQGSNFCFTIPLPYPLHSV